MAVTIIRRGTTAAALLAPLVLLAVTLSWATSPTINVGVSEIIPLRYGGWCASWSTVPLSQRSVQTSRFELHVPAE